MPADDHSPSPLLCCPGFEIDGEIHCTNYIIILTEKRHLHAHNFILYIMILFFFYNLTIQITAYMEPDRLLKRYRRKRDVDNKGDGRRSKRQVPHIIYPEILVIVDYDGYRLHGGNNADVIKKKFKNRF